MIVPIESVESDSDDVDLADMLKYVLISPTRYIFIFSLSSLSSTGLSNICLWDLCPIVVYFFSGCTAYFTPTCHDDHPTYILGGVGHCFAWHVRVSPVFGFNF